MGARGLGQDAWSEIRQSYEVAGETTTALALRHGMSRSTIVRRAAKEGWQRRPPAAGSKPRTGAAARPEQTVPTEPGDHKSRFRRLLAVIDRQLMNLEHQMSNTTPAGVQDEERRARTVRTTLDSLERITEKITELDKEEAAHGAARSAKPDIDRMRAEIAERLERLNAHWRAQGPSQ